MLKKYHQRELARTGGIKKAPHGEGRGGILSQKQLARGRNMMKHFFHCLIDR